MCLAFGQNVCGFDLLRAKGRSYVATDGWSFVKKSKKYYDDAAVCLRAMILKAVVPNHFSTRPARKAAASAGWDNASRSPSFCYNRHRQNHHQGQSERKTDDKPAEELRAVLGVIRHGDRTPKQKMKLRVTSPELLDLMLKCTHGRTRKQAKLKHLSCSKSS